MIKTLPCIVIATILLLPSLARGQDLASSGATIWSVEDAPGMKRWIVIHDADVSKSTGVYHIEVIARKTGDPAYKVIHLAPHMAITEQALADSVIEPLQSGAVYPENFNDAHAAWQAQNDGAGGSVCTSTVIECMLDSRGDEK